MKFVKLIFTFVIMLSFGTSESFAQVGKHPRVIELEKSLAREGLDLMKGRFPDRPFLVSVKIDPLMRERSNSNAPGEKLPYLDMAEEEVIDEWDDPSMSSASLSNRVRKIVVSVSIPSNLTDDEVAELKSNLITSLGLLEGRDAVEISKRNWGQLDQKESNAWQLLGWGALGWVFLMIGFFALFWYATSRIGRSMKDVQSAAQKSQGAAAAPPANFGADVQDKKPSANSGDLKFNDPIKNRELVATGIRMLIEHRSFPSLEDMMILHRFSEEKPSDCGALLSEFPVEIRRKIFGYSFGPTWLDAMTNPGEVTFSCVETLNKCMRLQRNDLEVEWQELLTLVWRLELKRKDFFKGMNQTEAFAILGALPKSMALEVARENFPGAWAVLLDPSHVSNPLNKEKINLHSERAKTLDPLRDFILLNKYRNEKDLLEFLKTADPSTEKEVYQASGEKSLIWQIRPPFYKVFELSDTQYEQFVTTIRIEDWSLAMFNIARGERKEIEKRFSDKQRFRYFEVLKSYDSSAPPKARIGEVREKIAKLLAVNFVKWSQQASELPAKGSGSEEPAKEEAA